MIKHKDFSMNGIKKNNLFQQLINRINTRYCKNKIYDKPKCKI